MVSRQIVQLNLSSGCHIRHEPAIRAYGQLTGSQVVEQRPAFARGRVELVQHGSVLALRVTEQEALVLVLVGGHAKQGMVTLGKLTGSQDSVGRDVYHADCRNQPAESRDLRCWIPRDTDRFGYAAQDGKQVSLQEQGVRIQRFSINLASMHAERLMSAKRAMSQPRRPEVRQGRLGRKLRMTETNGQAGESALALRGSLRYKIE